MESSLSEAFLEKCKEEIQPAVDRLHHRVLAMHRSCGMAEADALGCTIEVMHVVFESLADAIAKGEFKPKSAQEVSNALDRVTIRPLLISTEDTANKAMLN